MRVNQFLPAIVFLFSSSCIYGQSNLKLAAQIDSLYEKDQSIQIEIKNAFTNKIAMDSILKIQAIEKQTFDRHIPIIKEIIAAIGYPTIKKVGEEASHHFFVLVQHSDSDSAFQSTVLPVLKKLSEKNEVPKKEYAFLYDRVQRNTSKKQLYGTQLSFDTKGNLFDSTNTIIYPADLDKPETVDKRRKEMGLEPLEQYYESVSKMPGRPRKKT